MTDQRKRDASPAIELREASRAFGPVVALDHVSLTISPGEFFALLGPSGSGKTTTLRLIAGFDHPDSGQVLLDGVDVTDIPPFERNVNTVFQDYALFPHMNVADNVAYGLRVRGVAAAERRKRALEMLDLVQLESFADRRSTQLSGGQKQRVALARALINQPKSLQQRLGITFVFVTHDQEEALSMANRVAVFNAGRIEQLDTPRALYTRPKTAFVAGFVGSANVVESDLAERLTGRRQAFAIRPELIRIVTNGAPPADHVVTEGVLENILYHGATSRCHVRTSDGAVFAVAQAESGNAAALPAPGTRVLISWPRASAVPLQ